MNQEKTNPTQNFRKILVSGIFFSAGLSSFLRADAQSMGREWFTRKPDAGSAARKLNFFQQDALSGDSGNDLFLKVATPGCAEMGTPADEIIFFGGSNCDSAFGLAGDDILYSYTGTTTDTLMGDGGPGADYMYVLGRGVVLGYGGTEEDEMELNSMKNVIGSGGDQADLLKGYSYNDDVILSGDAGDDVLGGYAYHGSVSISGGDDNDELHAIAIVDSAHTDGGPGDDRIYSGSKTKKQTAMGGSGNDFIYGASLTGSRNILDGGTGNDVLVVGITHPYSTFPAFGYKGSYLYGGAGDDQLFAHSGNDTLSGGGGMDLLRAYSGDDVMVAGDNLLAEADGGPGTDQLRIDFSLDLDVTAALLKGLERLDISGTTGNLFTVGGSAQIHSLTGGWNALTGSASTLVVEGNADDNVILKGSWAFSGTGTIGATTYNIFEAADSARLWLHSDVGFLIGIADASPAFSVTVSPVPSEGWVKVQFASLQGGTVHLQLSDLTGRLVYRESVQENIQQVSLDFSAFPAGVYHLEVKSGDSRSVHKIVLE
jgi:hypothetical protein